MTDKINVIDLGSSSVRMCCISNGSVLFKKSIVTRLAENKANGLLDKLSMERTADAVVGFYKEAKGLGGQIYIFATAAVRNALNGRDFAERLQELTGERVEILTGEQEAEIGILGALRGKDGALIDIGGGSTEIIVSKGGKIVYEKSLQLGAVNLKNIAPNLQEAKEIVKERLRFFGRVPSSDFYGVGGTVTSMSAILMGLEKYDRERVHGYVLSKEELQRGIEILNKLSPEEISQTYCVDARRAEVLPYGATILSGLFDLLKLDCLTVSESDNLEGFVLKKRGAGYER